MTQWYVCYDSLLCTHTYTGAGGKTAYQIAACIRRGSRFICVPWLTEMYAMTHSYVCHDSLICVPWPWLNICVPWLTYMYATTQFLFLKKPKQRRGRCNKSLIGYEEAVDSYVCHDSIYVPWFTTEFFKKKNDRRGRRKGITNRLLDTKWQQWKELLLFPFSSLGMCKVEKRVCVKHTLPKIEKGKIQGGEDS